jgi:hypothetical protein
VAVDVAEDESATVRVHQNRQVLGVAAVGPVDPHWDVTGGSRDGFVPDLGDGFRLGRWHEPRLYCRPGLRTGHGVDGREAGIQRLDQRGDL